MRIRLRRKTREDPQAGERCGELKPSFFERTYTTECVLRPAHSGSHVDEHGTRWRFLALPAKDGEVCGTYQVPARSEDSGLCAGCGMFDYKHRGQP